MCFLPKTKIISLRGIKSFYKLSEGYVSEGTGWLLSHPHRVPAGETEAWFAWFYNRLTSLEHTWKSKRPYNLAYYYTDLDKLQDKSSRLKHDCCPQENPETAPWIARKVEASPVCQHQRPKAAHQSCSWAALNPGVVLSFPSVTCLSLGLGTHHLILGARWPAFSRCMEWHFQCHNFTRNCFTETHLLARLPFLITLYQTNKQTPFKRLFHPLYIQRQSHGWDFQKPCEQAKAQHPGGSKWMCKETHTKWTCMEKPRVWFDFLVRI